VQRKSFTFVDLFFGIFFSDVCGKCALILRENEMEVVEKNYVLKCLITAKEMHISPLSYK
jgi:hypothetical protein